MLRKMMIVGLVLMMAGAIFAADLVMLDPVSHSKGPVTMKADDTQEIFYLHRYMNSQANYYLGTGAADDTMAVVFQPLAACSIYVAQCEWYDAGSYKAFVWDYSDDAMEAYPNGRAPGRGQSPVSPIGDRLFGPYVQNVSNTQVFEDMYPLSALPNGGIWRADTRPFVVGFVKITEDGTPHPLANDVSTRGFSYTWFGGPYTASRIPGTYPYVWGAYSGATSSTKVDVLMRVGVSYPNGAPPIIGSMNQLPNTLNLHKTVTVDVPIRDDNGWTSDAAELRVYKNGTDVTVFPLTDPDGTGTFSVTFSLDDLEGPAVAVDDVISYYVYATDDLGGTSTNEDEQLSFALITLPNSDAGLLLVDDGLSTNSRNTVIETYLQDAGVYYQYYNVADNKGIDAFTTNSGDYSCVYVMGYGTSTVPDRAYGDDAYSLFMNSGRDMLLVDQDYFFANGEESTTPTFSAGDFAYDFFGIESGFNDFDTEFDSVFFGEAGDPISGDFESNGFLTYPATWSGSWADGVTAAPGATTFFTGEINGHNTGIRMEHENGSKTAYLSFDAVSAAMFNADSSALIPTEQFTTLFNNFGTWFDYRVSAPEIRYTVPTVYALNQNYPNPFNPTTQITFAVPTRTNVSLRIFNELGQQVKTLYNGPAAPGTKTIRFDASNLSSGVYFYRLDAGSFSSTRKMVLTK